MLCVGDLIFDEDVGLNCHYTVYDCRNGKSWQEAEVLYDSETDKFKPLDIILDMRIKNICISENKLIIEASDE